MGRPSRRDERREEIITGLMRAMASHGYRGATIGKIARAARLAPGLVHHYFRSKQEILVALVERLEQVVAIRIQRRLGLSRGGGFSGLDAWIDAHVALGPDADPDAAACWVSIMAESVRQVEVAAITRRVMERNVNLLGKWVRQSGPGGRRRSRQIAAAILFAVQGALSVGVTAPGTFPRGGAAPAIKRMARGLVGKAERRMGS